MPKEGGKASPKLLERLYERAEAVEQWKLRGEVQVSHSSRSWRFNIFWYQKKNTFKMRVSAITQATLFVINGKSDGSVSAIDARGARYQSDDQKKLTKELLGIEFPIGYLKSWIVGVPSPQISYQDAHELDNQLINFVQDGWEIEYRYKEASQEIKEMTMKSEGIYILLRVHSFESE